MIQKPLHTPKKFQQKCKIFFGQREAVDTKYAF
jgi:hypothetical protein